MSHPNPPPRFRLASALAGAFLFTAGVLAQTPNGWLTASNALPQLAATLQPGETIGHEQVMREFLRCGTNEFLFVLPDGTQPEVAPDRLVVLNGSEQRYYISIRVLELPLSTPQFKEALRERIASQYPYATGLEEFETSVANHPGSGFQLRLAQPGVGPRLIRTVCVPFPAGVLEFTLNTDTNTATAGRRALDLVLLTLRSNERGKLEIVKRSDKT